eukprot:TRINITY_DN32540_c0_g1_i1.p2 TRINITY_DN32540_c0_g1~~TRINITY_DN32540_c0_g1_i1.p2  ORF type:complete len:107 (-),score=16.18 TRINITY_DN32540_c0_g1_i1:49-369(-)
MAWAAPRWVPEGAAERCKKQLREVQRCDGNPKRQKTKMCIYADQNWLQCASRDVCPAENLAFSRCWTSVLNSGAYQDPETREAVASCDRYLESVRRCMDAAAGAVE